MLLMMVLYLMPTSLRLLHTYQLEDDHYASHPEDDNFRIIYYWRHCPRVSYGFDRSGSTCYVFNIFSRCFSMQKFNCSMGNDNKRRGKKKFYKHICYRLKRKSFHSCIHNIIADLFIDNDDLTKIQIDHLDGDVWNNAVENLERVTPEENYRRSYIQGKLERNRDGKGRFSRLN